MYVYTEKPMSKYLSGATGTNPATLYCSLSEPCHICASYIERHKKFSATEAARFNVRSNTLLRRSSSEATNGTPVHIVRVTRLRTCDQICAHERAGTKWHTLDLRTHAHDEEVS